MRTGEALTEERPRVFQFDPGPIGIRVDPLLRVHGYKRLEQVRPDVRAVAQQCVVRAKTLLDPHLHYLRVGVDACSDGRMRLETGTLLHCKAFERYLGKPRFVIIAIITLGSRIDRQVATWLNNEDVLEAIEGSYVETGFGYTEYRAFTQAYGKSYGATFVTPSRLMQLIQSRTDATIRSWNPSLNTPAWCGWPKVFGLVSFSQNSSSASGSTWKV